MRNYVRGILIYLFIKTHIDRAYAENWEWTFYTQLTTWNDGTRFCHNKGGRIVNINNQAKKNILLDFKNQIIGSNWGDPVWMGVYYHSQLGTRVWQGICDDIGNHGYNNWESSDRPSVSKECVMMDGGSMKWKPEVCKQEYIVICEKPIDSATACSGFKQNDDAGNPICVKGVVDHSNTPNLYPSIESVFDPPCHQSFQYVADILTTVESSVQDTTIVDQTTDQEITSQDVTTKISSTDQTVIVTSVGNTEDSTEGSTTSEGSQSTDTSMHSTPESQQTTVSTPLNESTEIPSTTTEMNSLTCECNCSAPVNMTHEQLMEKLEELRSILTIVKKDTLKSKLKLISVRDDRPSSTAIGALGIILITLVIALVVLIDSMNLLTFLQKRKIKEKKA